MTTKEVEELYRRIGKPAPRDIAEPGADRVAPAKPETVSGALDVTLTLHGHCPSKKNEWTRSATGMRLPAHVKEQIETLTMQALFLWRQPGPVEHPELTFTFYVRDARRDRDGMLVTVLDCLQAAGVLVNDNIARSNGRMVVEPCVFVDEAEEHVEVRVVKR